MRLELDWWEVIQTPMAAGSVEQAAVRGMRWVGPVMGKPHSRVIYRDAVKSKRKRQPAQSERGSSTNWEPSNDGAYETVGSASTTVFNLVENVLLTRKILALGEGLTLKMGHRWAISGGSGAAGRYPKVEEDNGRHGRHSASSTRWTPFYRSVRTGQSALHLGWGRLPNGRLTNSRRCEAVHFLDKDLQHG